MRIEHQGGGEYGKRGPGAGPGPDHHRPAGACLVPRGRGRVPPPSQPGHEALSPSRRRDEHQHPAGTRGHVRVSDHGENQFDEVGRRRKAHDGRRSTVRLGPESRGEDVAGGRYAGGAFESRFSSWPRRGAWPDGQIAHHGRRRGGVEEERHRTRPAPGGPLGETDQTWRRTPAQPRLQGDHVHTGRRLDVVFDHPAANGASVQRHAHPGAHGDAAGRPTGGHGVIEASGQRRDLGAHADGSSRTRRGRRRWSCRPPQGSLERLRGRVRPEGRRPAAWPPT